MSKTNLTVSIYVRLSYDLHGTELGVERQEKECREYAEARGWTVGEVFIDNDLSATTGVQRPGFERLLASGPEAILCWHLDRLLRVSEDLERVIGLGVDVFSKEAGWFDLSNPAGRAVARTVTAWSTYEGEQKALRQKAAHRQRVDAGGMTATGRPWWPTRPLGFNLDGTHHEIEAPALRHVYDDILRGGTLAAAVRYLNVLGIRSDRGIEIGRPKAIKAGEETGVCPWPVGQWKASSLRPVLLNARNAGIYVYNGEEIGPAAWEPIVSEAVYRAVARILTDPSRKKYDGDTKVGFGHRENLLTGLARCAKCSHTVRAAWRRKPGGERAYKVYQCGGCKGTTVPAEWADSVVFREVTRRLEAWEDMLPSNEETHVNLAALRAEELALQSRKAELGELFIEGVIDRQALAAGNARADARLAEIADKVAEHALAATGAYFWDPETLWAWSDDGNGQTDVEKARPVIERVCVRITLRGPGKGRSDLLYGEHLTIDF